MHVEIVEENRTGSRFNPFWTFGAMALGGGALTVAAVLAALWRVLLGAFLFQALWNLAFSQVASQAIFGVPTLGYVKALGVLSLIVVIKWIWRSR